MAGKALKVGFDFDGVIAYNPLRILRLPIVTFQQLFLKKKDLHFVYPKGYLSRFLWSLAHESSFFPSYGFSELKRLMKENKIEGYLVTGRYSFLESSLYNWLKRHGAQNLFKEVHVNKKDEQPHLFKEKMLKKLKLDMYLEDNWDIVQHLSSKIKDQSAKTQIHWIYNIFDRNKRFSENIRIYRSFYTGYS